MGTRRGGPVPRIDRAAIEEAVIAVGFDRATTTTVARHLGVDQSSLYRHVPSRDELILGAADRVLAAADWARTAPDSSTYLRKIADTLWRVLREHPGLAAQLFALDAVPPASARIMVRGVTVLHGFGWNVPDAILILDSISDMTTDTIDQIEAIDRRGRLGDDGAAQAFADAAESPDSSPLAAEIASFMRETLRAEPRRWWERKLELLLRGAEALLRDG